MTKILFILVVASTLTQFAYSQKADESIQTAKETVNEAHHAQTELIQAEIRGEKTPLNLLMVHAQDHLMCALVVIDLAQEFIDVYKKLA